MTINIQSAHLSFEFGIKIEKQMKIIIIAKQKQKITVTRKKTSTCLNAHKESSSEWNNTHK